MARFELYGTSSCMYTEEAREWLEWQGAEYTEYDVEQDPEARERWRKFVGMQRTVPVLVEDGEVVQIGWHGRGCRIGD